jgi:hypothetical protein
MLRDSIGRRSNNGIFDKGRIVTESPIFPELIQHIQDLSFMVNDQTSNSPTHHTCLKKHPTSNRFSCVLLNLFTSLSFKKPIL